jgi:AraC-like DNA-binding protein
MSELSASISERVRFRSRLPAAAASPRDAASPRLARHGVFATRSEPELRAFLDENRFGVDFPADDRAALDVHINGVTLRSAWLGHVSYGRAIALTAAPVRAEYWLQFAAHGAFDVTVAGRRIRCDAHRGIVLSPTRTNTLAPERGCGRFALALSRDALVRELAALLGRPVAAPLEFATDLDLDHGYGRSLARYLRAAVDDFEEIDPLLRAPPALGAFEQFVINSLLLAHPHNYSEELRRDERQPASRDVRRAIDYIEANLTAPITLADIVEAAGVAGRVLFKHFKRTTGTSPMAYLRNARFAGVHEALRRARPADRVVEIAARWGFDHIGRFAIEYRRRFGEKPSQTKAAALARG